MASDGPGSEAGSVRPGTEMFSGHNLGYNWQKRYGRLSCVVGAMVPMSKLVTERRMGPRRPRSIPFSSSRSASERRPRSPLPILILVLS